MLRQGHLIVHPTEGVYGIAADACSGPALDRLEALKGRVPGRGWVLVAASREAACLWLEPDPAVLRLLEHPWSGPVTVVARATRAAPPRVVAADGSIAMRIDRHPIVAALGALLQRPWVTTSLNPPGTPPLDDLSALPTDLAQALAAECDGLPRPTGTPSTLIRCHATGLTVLRAGAVPWEELRAVSDAPA